MEFINGTNIEIDCLALAGGQAILTTDIRTTPKQIEILK